MSKQNTKTVHALHKSLISTSDTAHNDFDIFKNFCNEPDVNDYIRKRCNELHTNVNDGDNVNMSSFISCEAPTEISVYYS